jgi:flagellar export protein FliJ
MAREPILALLKLRRLAVEEARQGLAGCLAREDAAERALAESEAILHREMLAAQSSASDGEVEAFAAWLPQGRQAVRRAQEARDSAAAETALARAALTLARSAAEAVDNLVEQRRLAEGAEALKREQAVLDDIGQRKPADD